MSHYFTIHPTHPQTRLLRQAAQIVRDGGLIAMPTDSGYALACRLDDKAAVERMRRLRGIDDRHPLTLLCRDLSELATFAIVDNRQYRLLKSATPGRFVFILEATREVPRRVSHPSRKTIGLRVPEHVLAQALLDEYGAPLLSTSLILPDETAPLADPAEIAARLKTRVELVIDAGPCAPDPTTVVDLSGEAPIIVRRGAGDPARLGL